MEIKDFDFFDKKNINYLNKHKMDKNYSVITTNGEVIDVNQSCFKSFLKALKNDGMSFIQHDIIELEDCDEIEKYEMLLRGKVIDKQTNKRNGNSDKWVYHSFSINKSISDDVITKEQYFDLVDILEKNFTEGANWRIYTSRGAVNHSFIYIGNDILNKVMKMYKDKVYSNAINR